MMQEKGDEPVVKLAKNFIENCKDFEIRELPQKEQAKSASEPRTEQTDDLRVVRYDDYIKTCMHNKDFAETKNFVHTEWVGEADFFKKGGLKIFYNEDVDLKLEQAATAVVLESLYIGERILGVSPAFKFDIGQYCYTIMQNKDVNFEDNWFGDRPLYIYEYMEEEDLMTCIEKLALTIEAFQITVLYLPKLECALAHCSGREQMQILKSLNEFAFKNHICILATLQPYKDVLCDSNVFNSVHYVQRSALEQVVPQNVIYSVLIDYDNYASIQYRDGLTRAKRLFSIKLPEDVHFRDVE